MKIAVYKPELPLYEEVEPEIQEMYRSGMLYPGKFTERLEERIKNETKVAHVQAVSSCSMGLILLLSLLPEKTRVILPAFTFNASLQALEWNSLIPYVMDVDQNGQLDPNKVEDLLGYTASNFSAILPVHMWGNACHPEAFEQIAAKHGIRLFFDGAHCLGTLYKGEHISRFGDATIHSIAATKPLSAGEGGLFLSKHALLDVNFRDAASHGFFGSLDTRIKGTNAKIQEFNSILAYHALNHFDATKNRRTQLMEKYRATLSSLPIRIWTTEVNTEACYKDCTLFTENSRVRQDLEKYLNSHGIGTKRYFYPPIPEMGSFKGEVDHYNYPIAKRLSETCLNLPLYPALTDDEQEYIIGIVSEFFN